MRGAIHMKLENLISKGTNPSVYRDGHTAIKVFNKTAIDSNSLELCLINNEISVLKLINHKNIF